MAKDLFDEIRKMRKEMDQLFSDFYDRFYSGERLLPTPGDKMPALRPAVADVQETDTHVVATIELPGMKKEDITLHITENMLEVKAKTKEEKEIEEEGYTSYQSKYSGFYRRIPLPVGIDADETKATYKNGVLEVKMPKLEKEKRKEISID